MEDCPEAVVPAVVDVDELDDALFVEELVVEEALVLVLLLCELLVCEEKSVFISPLQIPHTHNANRTVTIAAAR